MEESARCRNRAYVHQVKRSEGHQPDFKFLERTSPHIHQTSLYETISSLYVTLSLPVGGNTILSRPFSSMMKQIELSKWFTNSPNNIFVKVCTFTMAA